MGNVAASRKIEITEQALAMFTGSESFYRHSLARNVIYTEGCKFISENGAAWLIDEIALVQNTKGLLSQEFQSWELTVDLESRSGKLLATDGGAMETAHGVAVYWELLRKEIPYTDFPLASIELYCCANGEPQNGKTIMLVSEY